MLRLFTIKCYLNELCSALVYSNYSATKTFKCPLNPQSRVTRSGGWNLALLKLAAGDGVNIKGRNPQFPIWRHLTKMEKCGCLQFVHDFTLSNRTSNKKGTTATNVRPYVPSKRENAALNWVFHDIRFSSHNIHDDDIVICSCGSGKSLFFLPFLVYFTFYCYYCYVVILNCPLAAVAANFPVCGTCKGISDSERASTCAFTENRTKCK